MPTAAKRFSPRRSTPGNTEAPNELKEAAKAVSLTYVNDERPGIRRRRVGTGFAYLDARGQRLRDPDALARIRSLVIPPAWTEVWICPSASGHLQATGFDARGRKQYRYHPKFRAARDEHKYQRMLEFARILPAIRKRVSRDLKLKGLPREKVLAAVVRLLETTLIRVGNDEYAKQNKSYGLTTLRDKHAKIRAGEVHFEFRGKSGVEHAIDLKDARLAEIVKQCQDLPGQELFQYLDDSGKVHDITSTDVNHYIQEISGEEFTAKDFRTWAGTVLASMALRELEGFDSQAQGKKNIVRAVESVAKRLGNTKSVCRKCYIHPAVIESYLDGSLIDTLKKQAEKTLKKVRFLRPEEAMVLTLLRQRFARSDN